MDARPVHAPSSFVAASRLVWRGRITWRTPRQASQASVRSSPRAGVSRACPAVPIADAGPRARVTPAEHQAAKLLTEPSTACHSAARGGPSVRPRGRPQPIKDEIRTSPECLQPLAYVQGSGVPPLPPPSRSLLSPKQAAPPSTEAYSVVAPRSRE